jgi:hypothetical protein
MKRIAVVRGRRYSLHTLSASSVSTKSKRRTLALAVVSLLAGFLTAFTFISRKTLDSETLETQARQRESQQGGHSLEIGAAERQAVPAEAASPTSIPPELAADPIYAGLRKDPSRLQPFGGYLLEHYGHPSRDMHLLQLQYLAEVYRDPARRHEMPVNHSDIDALTWDKITSDASINPTGRKLSDAARAQFEPELRDYANALRELWYDKLLVETDAFIESYRRGNVFEIPGDPTLEEAAMRAYEERYGYLQKAGDLRYRPMSGVTPESKTQRRLLLYRREFPGVWEAEEGFKATLAQVHSQIAAWFR